MKLLVASLLIFASLSGAQAGAQAIPVGSAPLSVEVGGGFTSIHANAGPGVCGCFYMNGFDAQAGVYGSSHFSVLVDVGRTKRNNVNGLVTISLCRHICRVGSTPSTVVVASLPTARPWLALVLASPTSRSMQRRSTLLLPVAVVSTSK